MELAIVGGFSHLLKFVLKMFRYNDYSTFHTVSKHIEYTTGNRT